MYPPLGIIPQRLKGVDGTLMLPLHSDWAQRTEVKNFFSFPCSAGRHTDRVENHWLNSPVGVSKCVSWYKSLAASSSSRQRLASEEVFWLFCWRFRLKHPLLLLVTAYSSSLYLWHRLTSPWASPNEPCVYTWLACMFRLTLSLVSRFERKGCFVLCCLNIFSPDTCSDTSIPPLISGDRVHNYRYRSRTIEFMSENSYRCCPHALACLDRWLISNSLQTCRSGGIGELLCA